MSRRRVRTAMLLATSLVAPAFGQASYDAATESIKRRTAAGRQAAAGNADRRVWDGVIADKKARTVTLLACATAIKPTDPAEFFVTSLASGKDYEALAVTPAKAADVRAALDFIGLVPGRPIDPEKNRHWPRGPRVTMTFVLGGKAVRAEALVVDTNTNKPLPPAGLVYTGSYTYQDEQGKTHVAADESDARPVAPTYNDPAALFDVPDQAPQGVVYGFRKPSPAFTAKPGETVDVVLTPATAEAAVAEWDTFVHAAVIDGRTRYAIQGGPPGVHLPPFHESADDLPHFLGAVAERADGSRDLFTTVTVAADVPVGDVRKLYAVLQSVEKDRGVKLDPSPGDPFHRAFFPDPQWRDRSARPGEPWELFLTRSAAGTLTAKLERQTDNPDRDAADSKVVESTTPADPAAFVKTINDGASRWSRAVFVYPPADLTYGELMAWVRPATATYPRIFVFPAEVATTRPATNPAP